mmetsp:Transcript_8419/g.18517  ORF Transcript_8419/g.18517 Transcript_8419/m.18517 type:complete len:228 (+) Transcript_8419:946-1629(+)
MSTICCGVISAFCRVIVKISSSIAERMIRNCATLVPVRKRREPNFAFLASSIARTPATSRDTCSAESPLPGCMLSQAVSRLSNADLISAECWAFSAACPASFRGSEPCCRDQAVRDAAGRSLVAGASACADLGADTAEAGKAGAGVANGLGGATTPAKIAACSNCLSRASRRSRFCSCRSSLSLLRSSASRKRRSSLLSERAPSTCGGIPMRSRTPLAIEQRLETWA